MNPILADIYSTVIPSAPYIIAAYAIFWIVLLIYIIGIVRSLKKVEAQISLLEEQMGRIQEADTKADESSNPHDIE